MSFLHALLTFTTALKTSGRTLTEREIDHQEKVLMESENQRREKSIFHLFLPWGIKIGFEACRSNAIRPIYMSIGEKND